MAQVPGGRRVSGVMRDVELALPLQHAQEPVVLAGSERAAGLSRHLALVAREAAERVVPASELGAGGAIVFVGVAVRLLLSRLTPAREREARPVARLAAVEGPAYPAVQREHERRVALRQRGAAVGEGAS